MNQSIPAIHTTDLTKYYSPNSIPALKCLNISVTQGEIFGFLGPNGSGKTTTIRLLLDLIRPTSGNSMILGIDCNKSSLQMRQKVGYLPGELHLYSGFTGSELIKFFTSLRPKQIATEYVGYLCHRLEVNLDTEIGRLSHGNRQKIGLILALMPQPELLILDEPTTGLDPLVQRQVLEILRETQSEGRTVFFSSHALADVEQICTRVGIIREGELVTVEEVQVLKKKRLQRIRLEFDKPIQSDVFSSLSEVKLLEHSNNVLKIEITGEIDKVIKTASRYRVISIESEQSSLEETFMAYYQSVPTQSD